MRNETAAEVRGSANSVYTVSAAFLLYSHHIFKITLNKYEKQMILMHVYVLYSDANLGSIGYRLPPVGK